MTNLKKIFNRMINMAQLQAYRCFYIIILSGVFLAVPCNASSQGNASSQDTKALCEVFLNGNTQIQQKIISCVTKTAGEHKRILVLIYHDKKNSGHYYYKRQVSLYRLTHYPAIVINSKTIIYPESGTDWEKSFNININRIISSRNWQFKISLDSKPFNKDYTAVTLGICDPDLPNKFFGNIVILKLCNRDDSRNSRNVYTEVTQLARKKIFLTVNKRFKTCPVPEQFILHNDMEQSKCTIAGIVYNDRGELVALRRMLNYFNQY